MTEGLGDTLLKSMEQLLTLSKQEVVSDAVLGWVKQNPVNMAFMTKYAMDQFMADPNTDKFLEVLEPFTEEGNKGMYDFFVRWLIGTPLEDSPYWKEAQTDGNAPEKCGE
jgi:hypothetical protein